MKHFRKIQVFPKQSLPFRHCVKLFSAAMVCESHQTVVFITLLVCIGPTGASALMVTCLPHVL